MKKKKRQCYICECMYKSYSPACMWYLKKITKHPHSVSLSKTTKQQLTICLTQKTVLSQHELTFCSDPSILTFTFLFSISASIGKRRRTALTGPGTIARSYTRSAIREVRFHLGMERKKKGSGYKLHAQQLRSNQANFISPLVHREGLS